VALTSLSLLLTMCCVTIAALVALVLCWRRLRRWWMPARVAGILVCELLLIFSAGLWLNRADDFYPSWSALLGGGPGRNVPPTAPTARLATSLPANAQQQGDHEGLSFAWRPPDLAAWRLGAVPIVYLPPAYFHSPTLSLPVIVALAPAGTGAAQGAWDDPAILPLARASGVPAVVLFLRTGAHLRLDKLAVALPARLAADLRVTPHRWALVGIGAAAASALSLYGIGPVQFGPLALVPATGAPLNAQLIGQATKAAGPELLVTAPDGRTATPSTERHRSASTAFDRAELTTALRWSYGRLPPALAPPVVLNPTAPTRKPSR
jgi:hypothetical protein